LILPISPQVSGLYADIDYECKKKPGPKRGIEKIIGPKTQKKLKQRARMPETKQMSDVRDQKSVINDH